MPRSTNRDAACIQAAEARAIIIARCIIAILLQRLCSSTSATRGTACLEVNILSLVGTDLCCLSSLSLLLNKLISYGLFIFTMDMIFVNFNNVLASFQHILTHV